MKNQKIRIQLKEEEGKGKEGIKKQLRNINLVMESYENKSKMKR